MTLWGGENELDWEDYEGENVQSLVEQWAVRRWLLEMKRTVGGLAEAIRNKDWKTAYSPHRSVEGHYMGKFGSDGSL